MFIMGLDWHFVSSPFDFESVLGVTYIQSKELAICIQMMFCLARMVTELARIGASLRSIIIVTS